MKFFSRKPKLEVVHSARGGVIKFKHKDKKDSFNIEMGPEGNFFVFTGRPEEYVEIRRALKEFLVASNREGWVVDE
jgi:hypothetical protein